MTMNDVNRVNGAANGSHGVVPRPRLCHLHVWPDYVGYGFNVSARKGLVGQYVHQVEPRSPAEVGGLRNGDRIVEVNGTNVGRENHKQVVERIRAVSGETVLLVVDPVTDKYFRDRKIVISGHMEDIEVLEAPIVNPFINNTNAPKAGDTTKSPLNNADSGGKGLNTSQTKPQYRLRQCHVFQWPNFEGYGFVVHTLKDLPGQYVGQVEKNSPAEAAGLKLGDRIVEVNGVNVEGDFHIELRTKIQSVVGQVRMLVVDADADKYFSDSKTSLHSRQSFVDKIVCPTLPRGNKSGTKSVQQSVSQQLDSCPYRLRLCHLKMTSRQSVTVACESQGDTPCYGFMLRSGSGHGRTGQYVGEVDPGSIAERAGLKVGDRVIEVNGFNVETESHREIIDRIKAVTGQTKLTVVDEEADKWFREHNIPLWRGFPAHLITKCATPSDDIEEPTVATTTESCQRENKSDSNSDFANREVSAVASRQESETQQNASTETAHDTALPHPYRLRLCRLKPSTASHPTPGDASSSSAADSGSSVVGYGFNVHADRYRVGHFIGSVEPDSAADKVGLQPGDRIIEVAGVNVETDSHNELAEKIKAARDRRRPEEGGGDGELLLLVVDQEADEYFKKHETLLDAHQPFVVRCGFDDGEDRQQEREQQQQQHQLQQLAENKSGNQSASGRLRLCQLKRWHDYDGYGFVLVAEKNQKGAFISRVEDGSPAAAGGLRSGDRLIEVNGVNVEEETHPGITSRILAVPGCLELLVVDDVSDRFFKSHRITPLDRHQSIVDKIVCPDHVQPAAADDVATGTTPLSSTNDTPSTTQVEIASADATDYKDKFRLCQLRTRPDFVGYGFDVVTERLRPTAEHYVGKVDAGSPADVAGLRDGDLIVAVNGVAVLESGRCGHDQLADRIKSIPNKVDIIVVDQVVEKWYRQRGLLMTDHLRDQLTAADETTAEIPVETTAEPTIETTVATVAETTPETTAVNTDKDGVDVNIPAASTSDHPVPTDVDDDHSHYRLRLCKLRRWWNYSGYGFNLHVYATTATPDGDHTSTPAGPDLYVIGAVEPGSPAEASGLRRGDRVMEVNGQKVTLDTCHVDAASTTASLDVVAMIRARPDRVNLLVADELAYHYFIEHGVHLDSSQPFVDVVTCPENGPITGNAAVNGPTSSAISNFFATPGETSQPNGEDSDIHFAASAREARLRMPKKTNVKNMNISLQEKHEMFEKL